MTMKKYVDIERVKPESALTFVVGEPLVVEEKIDFSNASIRSVGGVLSCFSRRQPLDEHNQLGGLWDMMQELNADVFNTVFGDRYIVFGEWAGNTHKIKYPDNVKKKLWVFDVWDTVTGQYVDFECFSELYDKWETADEKVKTLCPMVPVLYRGPFQSWEHLKSLCGMTKINAEPCGEGIVIKRQSHLDSKSSRLPAYVKLVHEKFSEVSHAKKPVDVEMIKAREMARDTALTIITRRRVEKILEKLIEDNIIPLDWNIESMKTISQYVPKAVYVDCVKEEAEIVNSIDNFGKLCGSLSMQFVKEILKEKNDF